MARPTQPEVVDEAAVAAPEVRQEDFVVLPGDPGVGAGQDLARSRTERVGLQFSLTLLSNTALLTAGGASLLARLTSSSPAGSSSASRAVNTAEAGPGERTSRPADITPLPATAGKLMGKRTDS